MRSTLQLSLLGGQKVDDRLFVLGWTISRLAEESGYSLQTVRNWLDGKNVDRKTFFGLSGVLNLDPLQLSTESCIARRVCVSQWLKSSICQLPWKSTRNLGLDIGYAARRSAYDEAGCVPISFDSKHYFNLFTSVSALDDGEIKLTFDLLLKSDRESPAKEGQSWPEGMVFHLLVSDPKEDNYKRVVEAGERGEHLSLPPVDISEGDEVVFQVTHDGYTHAYSFVY